MFKKKTYGVYKTDTCPFCGRVSTAKNSQKIPVCHRHKDLELENLRCKCGEPVDLMIGKFGPYFLCGRCGNQNYNKILAENDYPLVSMDDL